MNHMSRLIIPDARGLADAVAAWRDGEIVAFPTETIYGLGADATNPTAVARIYEAKGRPTFNPLIIHAHDAAALAPHAVFTPLAEELAVKFWPGPLTMVLNRNTDSDTKRPVADIATAGLSTIAVRVPSHPVARSLLEAFGRPVAAPSANPSGMLTATTPKHVAQEMADTVPYVVVGGRSQHGLESTIIDLTGPAPRLLRHGAIPLEDLEAVIGKIELHTSSEEPTAPGQLTKHYAPKHALRLNATDPAPGEAYLSFGPQVGKLHAIQRNLSEGGDLTEAAANLFMYLHEFDARDDITGIAVAPIPQTGLGQAINDRLARGAVR